MLPKLGTPILGDYTDSGLFVSLPEFHVRLFCLSNRGRATQCAPFMCGSRIALSLRGLPVSIRLTLDCHLRFGKDACRVESGKSCQLSSCRDWECLCRLGMSDHPHNLGYILAQGPVDAIYEIMHICDRDGRVHFAVVIHDQAGLSVSHPHIMDFTHGLGFGGAALE